MLHPVKHQHLYQAADVLLIVQAAPLDELIDTLHALQVAGTPALHLTVYAPWIANNNFMLGIKTVAESLGYSSDKLRLCGSEPYDRPIPIHPAGASGQSG